MKHKLSLTVETRTPSTDGRLSEVLVDDPRLTVNSLSMDDYILLTGSHMKEFRSVWIQRAVQRTKSRSLRFQTYASFFHEVQHLREWRFEPLTDSSWTSCDLTTFGLVESRWFKTLRRVRTAVLNVLPSADGLLIARTWTYAVRT